MMLLLVLIIRHHITRKISSTSDRLKGPDQGMVSVIYVRSSQSYEHDPSQPAQVRQSLLDLDFLTSQNPIRGVDKKTRSL